jgi:hypothetical protein
MTREQFTLLKQRVAARYDPEEIIDILALDSEELVEALEELVMLHLDKFDVEE